MGPSRYETVFYPALYVHFRHTCSVGAYALAAFYPIENKGQAQGLWASETPAVALPLQAALRPARRAGGASGTVLGALALLQWQPPRSVERVTRTLCADYSCIE